MNAQRILQALATIKAEAAIIEQELAHPSTGIEMPNEVQRILKMPFRDFVEELRKAGDIRIKGGRIFVGGLMEYDLHDVLPEEYKKNGPAYLGDLPVGVLIKISEHRLLCYRGIGRISLRRLREILNGYGITQVFI